MRAQGEISIYCTNLLLPSIKKVFILSYLSRFLPAVDFFLETLQNQKKQHSDASGSIRATGPKRIMPRLTIHY